MSALAPSTSLRSILLALVAIAPLGSARAEDGPGVELAFEVPALAPEGAGMSPVAPLLFSDQGERYAILPGKNAVAFWRIARSWVKPLEVVTVGAPETALAYGGLARNPTSQDIVTLTADGDLRVWTDTFTQMARISSTRSPDGATSFATVASSNKGRLVARTQASDNGGLQVPGVVQVLDWDQRERAVLRVEGAGQLSLLAFAPDDRHVLAVSEELAVVWELATGKVVDRLAPTRVAPDVRPKLMGGAFAPDGKSWFVQDGHRLRERLLDGTPVVTAETDLDPSLDATLTLDPGGRWLYLAQGTKLRRVERKTGAASGSLQLGGLALHSVVDPDGAGAMTSNSSGVSVWRLRWP